jgi:hypothetical protein
LISQADAILNRVFESIGLSISLPLVEPSDITFVIWDQLNAWAFGA